MTDTTTHRPLLVSGNEESWPYIMVPVTMLDDVRALLDANAVHYWADEEAVSIDGGPETVVINLGRRSDPKLVQRLLDSVP